MKNHATQIKKPIFIIGVPRSGTTLIADLISYHEDLGWFSNLFAKHRTSPRVSIFNRLTDIPLIGHCFRGKEIHHNKNRWRDKLPYPREAYAIWDLYSTPNFSKDYLMGRRPTIEENNRITTVIQKTLKYHHKKRFLNKMTGPARIGYLSEIFPDAYFIHIIRDPRAVVSSLLKVNFWAMNGGLDAPWWQNGLDEKYIAAWHSSGKNPAVLAAVQWRQIIEHARSEISIQPEGQKSYLEIKYEQFIKCPEISITNILNFTGLAQSRRVDKNLKKRTTIKNMNYKYNDHLSHEDIMAIESITKPICTELGYC